MKDYLLLVLFLILAIVIIEYQALRTYRSIREEWNRR